MQQIFDALFQFTDLVVANAGKLMFSFIVLSILWAILRSFIQNVVVDTAKIVRKARRKATTPKLEAPSQPPIVVAHPSDIKDEASRRLFEEEVEREKEQMRIRAQQQ